MFSLFASHEKKMRDNAANWLELADKVWHFRRDQLREPEAAELRQRTGELRQLVKAKADAGKLKLSIESLETVLRRTGGAIYPKSSLVENVEFFLVAAIVILGIRTYFVQPFKIPTNSMWPTYFGMTAEVFPPGKDAPGLVQRAFRFLAFGAQRREAIAPTNGEVVAEFDESRGRLAFRTVPGRTWLVIPTQVHEYTFYVDGQPATVRVPLDFNDFDRVVAETFFGSEEAFARQVFEAQQARIQRHREGRASGAEDFSSLLRLRLAASAKAGQPIVRFEILTGDQLFVDRISYHFVQPKVGQGFVFRTDHIPRLGAEQYYIKRLVGVPGDKIEVREPVLYRNGKPITGAAAFDWNAQQRAPYRGYVNIGPNTTGQFLFRGEALTVPADGFFALGDNSRSSLDGRYWGFVPRKDAVGRPLFIYYPFTRRWGPAK